MSVVPMTQQKTMLDYALAYINIGWHVLPLTPKTKQPLSRLVTNGVHGATNDPDVVRKWWTAAPDAGIGVAVLPSGLVAVDVDPRNGGFETMERLEAQHGALVSDVLALTGGGGEHRVFSASLVTNLPGKLGPGVDLKADGYICVEPSIHPSGIAYAWEASSDPLEGCTPSTLPGWVRDLARTAHATQVDATEFVSRYITPGQMLEVKEALGYVECDDYHEWIAVGQCLRSAGAAGFGLWNAWSQTSDKYHPSEMGKKWRSFRADGALNLETIFFKAQQNGWVNPMGKVASEREDKLRELAESAQRIKSFVPVDAVGTNVSPFPVARLDEVCQWICRTQGISNSVAVQMAAISLSSLAASRLYVSEYGDGAHLYQLISSQSVGDLLPMHRALAQILRDCGLRKMVREQRFTSPTTLYRGLMRAPATLWLAAEWGTMTAFAKRQSSGLIDHVLNLLVNAYVQQDICLDNPEELGMRGAAGVDDDMPSIRRPSLSMLAFTSESMLSSSFATGELGRGAVEQLLYHCANLGFAGEMQQEDTPEWLVDHLLTLRRLPSVQGTDMDLASIFNGNAQLLPTQTVVTFAAQPSEHYPTFDALCAHPRAAMALARGARVQLRRLSVALAAWENPKEPVVTPPILDWCATFVADRLKEAMAALHFMGGSEDGKSSLYQAVLHCIAQTGSDGMTMTQVVRSNYKFRSLTAPKRDELIGQLLEDGELIERPNTNGKGTRLVAASFLREVAQ